MVHNNKENLKMKYLSNQDSAQLYIFGTTY